MMSAYRVVDLIPHPSLPLLQGIKLENTSPDGVSNSILANGANYGPLEDSCFRSKGMEFAKALIHGFECF